MSDFEFPFLRSLHFVSGLVLKTFGYHLELRRNGELKIGLWRKSFRKNKSQFPKRLVMMPGFGDSSLAWLTLLAGMAPVLRRKFDEVIVIDFPGFSGFLYKERPFHSMDLMMSAVNDILDSLRPETLMGHSLGGWLSASYAGKCGKGEHPKTKNLKYEGPKSVILIAPSGLFSSPESRTEWEDRFRTVAQTGFSTIRPHLFAKEPLWFKLIARESGNFLAREEIDQFVRSVREDHLMTHVAGLSRSKMWLVWGEKDELNPTDWAPAWLDILTDCTAIIIKDAGHSPQMEKPALTASILGRLLFDRLPLKETKQWWKILEKVSTT